MSPTRQWRKVYGAGSFSGFLAMFKQTIYFGKVDRAKEQENEGKMTAFHLLGFLSLGLGLVISVSIKEFVIEEEDIM